MTRFYFNMRTPNDFVEDPEGVELADLAQAQREAIEDARAAMSLAILRGVDMSAGSAIEICDEQGTLLKRVPFADAIVTRC